MRLPSPSMAVSLTALVVALGGTSYAATKISANSVGSAQIKSNAVGASEIKSGAVGSSEVKNGSLRAADFGAGSLPAGAQGPQGPQGPQGIKGDQGAKGDQGDANTRWVLVNRAGTIEAQSGGFRMANAYPAGGAGEANVYLDSGDTDLSDNGIVASIALENQYSLKGATPPPGATLNNGRNGGPDVNPEFSGEITATKCAIATVVACAPVDLVANGGTGVSTNTNRYFVVSPRNSDGSFTVNDDPVVAGDDSTHKRFYVVITGTRTAP